MDLIKRYKRETADIPEVPISAILFLPNFSAMMPVKGMSMALINPGAPIISPISPLLPPNLWMNFGRSKKKLMEVKKKKAVIKERIKFLWIFIF
jgi:hypothetical protein